MMLNPDRLCTRNDNYVCVCVCVYSDGFVLLKTGKTPNQWSVRVLAVQYSKCDELLHWFCLL